MSIAFDALSQVAAEGTGNLSWTHTPVGTPRGIVVFIAHVVSATDQVTGVTYGGVPMTEMAGSPNILSVSGLDVVYGYFLGSGIPTGAQTVAVTVTGAASPKWAGAVSVTAAQDTVIQDTKTINNGSLANPTVTLSLGGNSCFCTIGFAAGPNAVTGTTETAGWTAQLEHDFGSDTMGLYTYNTIGTADVAAGWTQVADDACAIAVAVKEAAAETITQDKWAQPTQKPYLAPASVVGY
jgi:hypothetical protein